MNIELFEHLDYLVSSKFKGPTSSMVIGEGDKVIYFDQNGLPIIEFKLRIGRRTLHGAEVLVEEFDYSNKLVSGD